MLSVADWRLINRLVAPPEERARTVSFDTSSPVLCALARLLSRLDAFDRLTFGSLLDDGQNDRAVEVGVKDGTVTPRALSERWVVVDPKTSTRSSGRTALAECVQALACGRPVAWFLRTGAGRTCLDLVVGFVARREATIEAALALEAMAPARGVATATADLGAAERTPAAPFVVAAEPPVRLWLRRRATHLRELALAVLVVAVASQVLMENKAVPAPLKFGQPKWIQQIVGYPRMFQGWGMFSTDVPLGERMLYVDAVTFGGRHVDPFNEAGSRIAQLPVERIPPHMEQNEFWCDYTNRIPERQAYWRMLKEWIMAYHLRTMRREDRVISFEAKLLESDSPPPGEHEPRNFRTKVMMTDHDP
jgi:hypothetical protein